MTRFRMTTAAMLVVFTLLFAIRASALPIREFRKFSPADQATYITAAVSMLAYSYAANGDSAKGRCVQHWYFGANGQETSATHDLASRIDAYEHLDAEKYHVEGVIMGLADKACPAPPPKP